MAYSKTGQAFKMERFVEIVKNKRLLIILTKRSILDV